MLGVRCAAKRILQAICPLLAEAAFLPASGQCSVQRHRFVLPEPVTRRGLSLARNSACALQRGLRSRPSPSLPRGKTLRIRSIYGSSAPSGFRGRSGANSSPQTRYPRSSTALPLLRRSTLPDWPLQPFGSKRSIAPATKSSLCEPSDSPSLPAAYSVRFALRINVRDSPRFARRIVP